MHGATIRTPSFPPFPGTVSGPRPRPCPRGPVARCRRRLGVEGPAEGGKKGASPALLLLIRVHARGGVGSDVGTRCSAGPSGAAGRPLPLRLGLLQLLPEVVVQGRDGGDGVPP